MYEFDVNLIRKLSEVGYMACFKGYPSEGEAIMEGVHAAKPNQVPVMIGLAVAKLTAGKYPDAIAILRDQVGAIEPDNLTAKCFLGLALKEYGESDEADAVLLEVQRHGDDSQRAVAEVYLQPK